MRKAVVVGPKQFAIKEVPVPDIGSGEILVKIKYCGICSSEVHGGWSGGSNYPIKTFGHEVMGVAKEIGPEVEKIKPGMRVTGFFRRSFADYAVINQEKILRIPDNIPDKVAAAVSEPLSCIISAIRRLSVDPGDEVAVIGLGFMGLLQLKILLLQGATRIVGVDVRQEALQQAKEFGADEVYLPSKVPGAYIINSWDQLGNDFGLDHVIEASGNSKALNLAGEMVKIHQNLMILGYHQNGDRKVDMELWNWKALNIINGHERRKDYQLQCMKRGLDLLQSQRLNLDSFVTHEYGLSEINKAFADAVEKPKGYIKGIIEIY